MRKNQPLVPRSNIAGSWARGGGGYPTFVPSNTNLSKTEVQNGKARVRCQGIAVPSAAVVCSQLRKPLMLRKEPFPNSKTRFALQIVHVNLGSFILSPSQACRSVFHNTSVRTTAEKTGRYPCSMQRCPLQRLPAGIRASIGLRSKKQTTAVPQAIF